MLQIVEADQEHLELIHYARHGPQASLESLLHGIGTDDLDILHREHNGFPLLFQPLIECTEGWTSRLKALLAAGVDVSALYRPWNCSAFHMLVYKKPSGRVITEKQQLEGIQLLLQFGAKAPLLNRVDCSTGSGNILHTQASERTAVVQAAASGHLQVCRALLQAGADGTVIDRHHQSILDYLFYLKHSNLRIHRLACSRYRCMDLYAMVIQFQLQELVTEELQDDCKKCTRCRFFLAGCVLSVEEEPQDVDMEIPAPNNDDDK